MKYQWFLNDDKKILAVKYMRPNYTEAEWLNLMTGKTREFTEVLSMAIGQLGEFTISLSYCSPTTGVLGSMGYQFFGERKKLMNLHRIKLKPTTNKEDVIAIIEKVAKVFPGVEIESVSQDAFDQLVFDDSAYAKSKGIKKSEIGDITPEEIKDFCTRESTANDQFRIM